jgi:hypothetical protein
MCEGYAKLKEPTTIAATTGDNAAKNDMVRAVQGVHGFHAS